MSTPSISGYVNIFVPNALSRFLEDEYLLPKIGLPHYFEVGVKDCLIRIASTAAIVGVSSITYSKLPSLTDFLNGRLEEYPKVNQCIKLVIPVMNIAFMTLAATKLDPLLDTPLKKFILISVHSALIGQFTTNLSELSIFQRVNQLFAKPIMDETELYLPLDTEKLNCPLFVSTAVSVITSLTLVRYTANIYAIQVIAEVAAAASRAIAHQYLPPVSI